MKELKAGQYVNYPRAIIHANKDIECPVCGRFWSKSGRGFGFVKHGAQSHVSCCFEKKLRELGLQLKSPYDMNNLGWKLISLPNVEREIEQKLENQY